MEIIKKEYFIEIIANDDEYITLWDKENIEEYSGSKIIYAPLTFDTSLIYSVSLTEHEELTKQQEKIIEENNKKYDNHDNQ